MREADIVREATGNRIALAASPGELLSVSVVFLEENIVPDLLIYNLAHSHNVDATIQYVRNYCDRLAWPLRIFSEFQLLSRIHRGLRRVDRRITRRKLENIVSSGLPTWRGGDNDEIWISMASHTYVQEFVKSFPKTARVLYPHAYGIFPSQIDGASKVRARKDIVTIDSQCDSSFHIEIDRAYTFTRFLAPVATKRIDEKTYEKRADQLAEKLGIDAASVTLQNDRPIVVVSLSEYQTGRRFYAHIDATKQILALEHLIRESVAYFDTPELIIKPHPRSNYKNIAAILSPIIASIASPRIRIIPPELHLLPLQILATKLNIFAEVSILSSAGDGVSQLERYGSSIALNLLLQNDTSSVAASLRSNFLLRINDGLIQDIDTLRRKNNLS